MLLYLLKQWRNIYRKAVIIVWNIFGSLWCHNVNIVQVRHGGIPGRVSAAFPRAGFSPWFRAKALQLGSALFQSHGALLSTFFIKVTFTPLGKAWGVLKTCEMENMANEISKDVSLKMYPHWKMNSSYTFDLEKLQRASMSAALTF